MLSKSKNVIPTLCVYCLCVLVVQSVTLWTVALQALLSMEFSRQEYWSGLPFPSLGDLHNPGIKLGSPVLQVDSLPSEPPGLYAIPKKEDVKNKREEDG